MSFCVLTCEVSRIFSSCFFTPGLRWLKWHSECENVLQNKIPLYRYKCLWLFLNKSSLVPKNNFYLFYSQALALQFAEPRVCWPFQKLSAQVREDRLHVYEMLIDISASDAQGWFHSQQKKHKGISWAPKPEKWPRQWIALLLKVFWFNFPF